MSETLWGVVIGGFIASITPTITIIFEYRKWSRERRIEHLKNNRNQLYEQFSSATEQLTKAVEENNYPLNLITDFDHIFPKTVSDSFNALIQDEDKTMQAKKIHLFTISKKMKEHISAIDRRIELELGMKIDNADGDII